MSVKYIPKWTIIYALELVVSSATCLLAAWSLNRSIKILNSCLCLATFGFFICEGLFSLSRAIFFLLKIHAYLYPPLQHWVVLDKKHDVAGLSLIGHRQDDVLEQIPTGIATIIIFGDALNIASTLWMLISIRELLKLASKTVDRGHESEKKVCKRYTLIVCIAILCYTIPIVTLQSTSGVIHYRAISIQFITALARSSIMLLSICAIVYLRYRGRNTELVHGRLIRAPLYERLKRIVYVES